MLKRQIPGKITFHSDSLSALQALEALQATEITSRQCLDAPETWTSKQIVTFIQTTKCKDLMIDETDYRNMTGNSSRDTETSNSRNSISI